MDRQSAAVFGELLGMFICALAIGYFAPLYVRKGPDGKRGKKTIGGVMLSTAIIFVAVVSFRLFAKH